MKTNILIAVSALILILFSLLYFDLPFNIIRPVFHSDTINRCAVKYGVDPLLITSIIKVESNFFHKARSRMGAIGLMQLLPSTAEELAPELGFDDFSKMDLENPDTNIKFGSFYIGRLIENFDGNIVLAVAAYNAGIGKVRGWYLQNPLIGIESADMPYRETRNYVNNVMRTYRWLKRIQKLKTLINPIKA